MTDIPLSDRETELLTLVATGASNKEISQQLHISVNTVKVHLQNIFGKLEVSSRTEAAMWAVQNGVVDAGGQGDRRTGSGEPSEPEDVEKGGTVSTWLTRIPRGTRYWLLGAVAVLFVIIGFGISQIFRSVQNPEPTAAVISASEFEESRWKQLADLPTARAGLAAAANDNQIYAIAGEGVAGVLDVNERYDPLSDTWETLAPKPLAVADVHAGVIGGKIFVPGGRLANGEVSNVLEIYDPRSGTWSEGASLPVALSAYALATFEGKLYVFGGWDGESYLDSVYMYDPAQDAWSERMPMPTARAFAGAAEAGGKIYVIGGYDGDAALDVNEVYTPALDGGGESPWSEEMPMPEGRYGMGVANTGDNLFVIGGFVDSINKSQSSEFSNQNMEWRKISNPMKKPWKNMGVINLGTKLLFFGGVLDGAFTSNTTVYTAVYTVVLPVIVK